MEFDNDRLIKPPYKIELFSWALIGIMNPLVNSLGIFWGDIRMLPVLLFVSVLLLPVYILYSRLIVPGFLFKKRRLLFAGISIAVFIVIQLLLAGVYAIVSQFNISAPEQLYFSFSYRVFAREGFWTLVNMSLATVIAFIKKELDEKDLLANIQKDSNFFKLRYLRAQLNPHFLFNTLNSIYALSLQKSDKTPEVVIKLADLMRYLIYECNEEKISLDKEIEFIRNYMDIERIRHNADVRFSVEGQTDGIMIEPFLFISFIENGFKHAFNNSHADPFIYITIKVEDGQIVLNVINNTNIDLETQAKRMNGKGITNSRSLLELLYPDSYALDIIQTEKEESRKSNLRLKNARECLETLYPDSHTLDVILSNNAFTVSLIIKHRVA